VLLVDTSVWIDWLGRRKRPGAALLDAMLDTELIGLPAVVLQELLQGASNPERAARIEGYFSRLAILLPTTRTYADAGMLYARCRWAGITPRSPHDCLIAQHALERDAVLLHDDADFERIGRIAPGLRLLRG